MSSTNPLSQRQVAIHLYDALAGEIAPYRRLKHRTGKFNALIRSAYCIGHGHRDYISLRLDAHHIIEAVWYGAFADDFRRKLSWCSPADMHAIALHTEWHIRTGARMATDHGLLGGEGHSSITTAIQTYLGNEQLAQGRFPSLGALFDAHERFYRDLCGGGPMARRIGWTSEQGLWARLQRWFCEMRARLH